MSSQEYMKWSCEFVEENYEKLRVLTGVVFKNHRDERITECMSYIMLNNLPNVLKTWDPSRGDCEVHVWKSWKWYVWKWLKSSDKHREHEALWHDGITPSYEPLDLLENIEIIEILKSEMHPHYWMLLRKRFMEGESVTAICAHCCLSRSTVAQRLNRALETAREILSARLG